MKEYIKALAIFWGIIIGTCLAVVGVVYVLGCIHRWALPIAVGLFMIAAFSYLVVRDVKNGEWRV